MRGAKVFWKWFASVLWLPLFLTGCESTVGGGGSVSGGMYYGTGLYDPWYYGAYWNDVDVIVTPPDRPDAPVRPAHPIARPPSGPSVSPRPMPSIPATPRATLRR